MKEKGSVVWLPLDLTTPSDVVKSAKDFMAKEQQLDILGMPKESLWRDLGVL